MGWARAGVLGVACMTFACSEAGSLVGVDGGENDATESHDTVFVPQVDDDSGDGTMQEPVDGGEEEPVDAGDEPEDAISPG